MKHLFGFEYLIAPYTIAHLKLSQYIKDQKHTLKDGERLQVFLTNTLEPIEPQKNLLLPEVTAEVEAAQTVKEKAILVITGNPPYSGHSKNKGAWITAQVGKYREGFPELAKPAQGKWLQDDYVKFIRFAQMKMDGGEFEFRRERGNTQTIHMEGVEQGVVGIITNHSWIDNPTFKGMRKSLMGSFNQIYVLDLHGNSKKNERAPGGGDDQNVFDIEQGVAISLFVKQPNSLRGVWHADVWGRRIDKYRFAADATRIRLRGRTLNRRSHCGYLSPTTLTLMPSTGSFGRCEIFSRLWVIRRRELSQRTTTSPSPLRPATPDRKFKRSLLRGMRLKRVRSFVFVVKTNGTMGERRKSCQPLILLLRLEKLPIAHLIADGPFGTGTSPFIAANVSRRTCKGAVSLWTCVGLFQVNGGMFWP